jgi:hypothetical protein
MRTWACPVATAAAGGAGVATAVLVGYAPATACTKTDRVTQGVATDNASLYMCVLQARSLKDALVAMDRNLINLRQFGLDSNCCTQQPMCMSVPCRPVA